MCEAVAWLHHQTTLLRAKFYFVLVAAQVTCRIKSHENRLFERTGSPDEYFYWINKTLAVLSVNGLKCLAFLVQDKIIMKCLLASLKVLTNFKDCSESCRRFLFGFLSLLLLNVLQGTFMADFPNNFQDHRRLSEQLSESQAAIRKLEQAPWRRLGTVLEGFSQIVSDFIEASWNFILDFLHKKTAENCENHFSAHSKSIFWFLGPSKCSGSGSVCFWSPGSGSGLICTDPAPGPSINKKKKKTLDFYCFVTSLRLFIYEEWCKYIFKKEQAHKFRKKIFFVGVLKVTDLKRIRIRIRQSKVRIPTVPKCHGPRKLISTTLQQATVLVNNPTCVRA